MGDLHDLSDVGAYPGEVFGPAVVTPAVGEAVDEGLFGEEPVVWVPLPEGGGGGDAPFQFGAHVPEDRDGAASSDDAGGGGLEDEFAVGETVGKFLE